MPDKTDLYKTVAYQFSALEAGEVERCIQIIKAGDAIEKAFVRAYFAQVQHVVICRLVSDETIVGLGAIKSLRPKKAQVCARNSQFSFDDTIPELGYVAIDAAHRGHGLSYAIVEKLCEVGGASLYATTDKPQMKKTLATFGFKHCGRTWDNDRLSLWIRTHEAISCPIDK